MARTSLTMKRTSIFCGVVAVFSGVLVSCGEKKEEAETKPTKEKTENSQNPSGMKPKMVNGYLEALPVPGREGFVFNPYTEKIVDVRGINSGSLIRDPGDPNQDHKFRVP